MKSNHKVIRFDYLKITTREDMRYFGIHPKSGRVHIDTKRYKKILEEDGFCEFLPHGLFLNRNTPYKPLFGFIKTPEEYYNDSLINGIASTVYSDDIDEIESKALLCKIYRKEKYSKALQSLYLIYILKLALQIERTILTVMVQLGYEENDFYFKSFKKFSNDLLKNKPKKEIEKLKNYDEYDLLRRINNFLKHNSIRSYNYLRKNIQIK